MCIFCNIVNDDNVLLQESGHLISCFFDQYPITQYHMLFVPNRHVNTYFDLWLDEKCHVDAMIMKWSKKLQIRDSTITGFNIGWNCGYSAGQTIDHAHCHLIPRRDGDVDNPTGGIRCIIPELCDYTK